MFKKNKGFTLLELLVVIAIIGILSTIVLVSLQSARRRAQDAAIQSQLAQIPSAAELYRLGDGDGGFEGLCANTGVDNLIQAISKESPGTVVCEANENTYCASAEAVEAEVGGVNVFCVDSEGARGLLGACVGSSEAGWNCPTE